jgi:PAS domain S-box-containing protein
LGGALVLDHLPVIGPTPEVKIDELAALYLLTDRLYRARGGEDIFEAALDAITSTLGCRRASILLFDERGVMDFVAWRGLSAAYRRAVRGHTPWKPTDADPAPIFVADIDDTNEPEGIKSAVHAEGIRGLAFIPLMVDGTVAGKFMTYYEAPRIFAEYERDLAVTIARQVGFSLERARAEEARRRAERELRESEERFRLMSEHAPVMIWMSDASGRCLHLNRMLREFWAVEDDNLAEFDWRTMMHPDDADRIGQQMWNALISRTSLVLKGRFRNATGEYRVLHTHARPRLSPDGEFLGMLGVNIDITDRERADAQRELLVAELNHRVKNTLAVVQSIAYQTFRSAASPDALRAFEGRLMALSAAHNLLTQSHWESAPLHDLVADTLQTRADKQRARFSGPHVLLPPKHAIAIAMILHELGTNALKYGALSNDQGQVALEWCLRNDGSMLDLLWREQGGPPVAPPTRRGFGSVLLERMLDRDLNGKLVLDFHPDGVQCRITTPLAGPASTSA